MSKSDIAWWLATSILFLLFLRERMLLRVLAASAAELRARLTLLEYVLQIRIEVGSPRNTACSKPPTGERIGG